MEFENNTMTPRKSISKKKIFFWIGSIVFVAVVVTVTLFIIHRFQLTRDVHDGLKNASTVMEKLNGDNGYPQKLTDDITKNEKVTFEGGGSFDGTTYCITGTNVKDASIVYHISNTDKEPQNNACPEVAAVALPGSVLGIETTIISAGQLGFTWQPAAGGVSYTLQCATDTGFEQVASSTMKASVKRTCNELKDGTSYYVRIRANNASGAGPWSSALNFSTTQLSIAPTKLTLKAVSTSVIDFTFDSVNGASSYVVEWASDINYTKDVKTATLSTTSGSASGLNADTRYFFHVKAITAGFDASHAAFSPQEYTSTLAK